MFHTQVFLNIPGLFEVVGVHLILVFLLQTVQTGDAYFEKQMLWFPFAFRSHALCLDRGRPMQTWIQDFDLDRETGLGKL